MKNTALNNALLLAALLLMTATGLFAQKKVLGKPELFNSPVDYFSSESSYEKFLRVGTKNKDKENAWLVISDRDGNNLYEKPTTSSSVIGTLQFRDFCYVINEEEDWVEVVDASVDKLKIVNLKKSLGWVPKKKMLLWNSGIVQLGTNIHRKVLLLNRADDIIKILKLENKEIVRFYKGPETEDKETDRKIFDFYFVMKKEAGRVLLCEESEVSTFNMDKIIGWVDERRCSPWNNRICLEPNFTPEGFEERKANPKIQLKAFNTEEAAKNWAELGIPDKKELFWQDDAVTVRRDKMSKSNPNRFAGTVVRFPMLYSTEGGQGNFTYFKSGIIGSIKLKKDGSSNVGFDSEIPEVNYGQVTDEVGELNRRTDHVNIFFVIEGTDSTYGFKNSILQSMKSINSELGTGIADLKYGALVYRDIPEEKARVNGQPTNRMTEYISLTPDFDKVLGFIQKSEFRNYEDRDEYTALYHGVRQALTQAAFRENELNIIIIVGSYGDFRADKDRKAAALKAKHPAFVEDFNPLFENLTKINAHLYALQLRNEGIRPSEAFAKQTQFMILETAKYAYIKFYGNKANPQSAELLNKLSSDHGIRVGEPSMADVSESNDIKLKGGRFPSGLFKPGIYQSLSASELSQAIKSNVKESLEFERMLKKIVDIVFTKGGDADIKELESELKVDIGRFLPAFADMLTKVVQEDNVAKNDLLNSLDEKYKLYTEAYLPYFYQGAKNPATSYVLFMPESELVDYKRTISRLVANAESSDEKRRNQIFETYIELITQFSGETGLRNRKAEDITREEVAQLMQGLYGSGLRLNVPLDFRIGDLRDEKKVSRDEIEALMRRFKEVESNLDKALRGGDSYDFCYTSESGHRYYWIALEEAF